MTDTISDFLTRIRNAQAARHDKLEVPSSKMKFAIAKILEREGFVSNVEESSVGVKKTLVVTLKYDEGKGVIRKLKRISKPGLRVYRGSTELPRVLNDLGIAIVSTSSGIMTNKDARRRKLGGEVLCEIM